MLRINDLVKRYGAHKALAGASLCVRPGEIHGLAGLNGSGKTTLLNILFGAIKGGFEGEITLDGRPYAPRSPKEAMARGVGMIHQELSLFNGLTVAENITLTRESGHPLAKRLVGRDFCLERPKDDRARARRALTRLGLSIDPDVPAAGLSLGARQFVEIAREIDKTDLRLLLLDEPTAALSEGDARRLLEVLREFARAGVMVVYVSHRLDEMAALCDAVTALRDGEVAARFSGGCSPEDLAGVMAGKGYSRIRRKTGFASENAEPALEFADFEADAPGERLTGVNLRVGRGEIVGLAGLSGHGKLALAKGAMGLCPVRGELRLFGEPVPAGRPHEMLRRGACLLPEDRRTMGLLPGHSVVENMVLPAAWNTGRFLRRFPGAGLSFLRRRECEAFAEGLIERLGIKCAGPRQRVDQLSGGNQQKVAIARAMALSPRVLFACEPTRGVDIAAKERILALLLSINEERGTSVVMASSELEELSRVCDRTLAAHQGRLAGTLQSGLSERDFALGFARIIEKAAA